MIRETAAPDPVKKLEPAHPTLKRFAYLLKESDPERGTRWGLYAFTIAPEEHLQMAYYFDVEKDLEWAIQAWDSLVYGEGVSGSPA